MHLAAIGDDILLETLEIEIEMRERMVLDRDAFVAQRLEFRQPRDRLGALFRKTGAHHGHRALQIGVAERAMRIRLEGVAGRLHQLLSGSPMGGVVVGHVRQHFGDMAYGDGFAEPRELARHVEEAAHIAAEQRIGAGRGDIGGFVARPSCRRSRDI